MNDTCEYYGITEDDLTEEDLEHIDEHIFLCTNCMWWFTLDDQYEHDDELICGNCMEDINNGDA